MHGGGAHAAPFCAQSGDPPGLSWLSARQWLADNPAAAAAAAAYAPGSGAARRDLQHGDDTMSRTRRREYSAGSLNA